MQLANRLVLWGLPVRVRIFALVLVSAVLTVATSHAAPSDADRPRRGDRTEAAREPAPSPGSRRWTYYGWKILLADALLVGGPLTIAVATETEGTGSMLIWPTLGYVLAGPAVHAGNGQPRRAGVSLGIRVGAPLIGAAAGAGAVLDGDWVKIAAAGGAVLGAAAAGIVDWTLLSIAPVEPRPRAHNRRRGPPTRRALLWTGGATFGIAYGLAAAGALIARDPKAAVPVIGPIYGVRRGSCHDYKDEYGPPVCEGNAPTVNVALVLDAAVQVAGIGVFAAGIARRPGPEARPTRAGRVVLTPTFANRGTLGLSVAGSF